MAADEKGARGWSRSFFDGAITLYGVGETQLQDIFCRPLGPEKLPSLESFEAFCRDVISLMSLFPNDYISYLS